MSENKLTDREIIGALENLLFNRKCNIAKSNEQFITLGEIINLINRQQAEIERLNNFLYDAEGVNLVNYWYQQCEIAENGCRNLEEDNKKLQSEIERLSDSAKQWEETAKDLLISKEKQQEEIEKHKNNCENCGVKTRMCIENLQNNIAKKQAEIDRLQSILVRFLDEISEWGNKNNVDTTNFSTIPIAESEKESIIKQLRFEVLKEYMEKLKGHWRFRGGVIPWNEIYEIIDETYKEIVK